MIDVVPFAPSLNLANRTFYNTAALNLAETGIEEALYAFNQVAGGVAVGTAMEEVSKLQYALIAPFVILFGYGYRLLNQEAHKGGLDRADAQEYNTTTIWVVKCI